MTTSRRYHSSGIVAIILISAFTMRPRAAHASVTVLLEEPYGPLSHLSPSGHVAIYLDHVCAETPLRLRQCRLGEFGVVISRYDGIGNHDWIAVPLIGYLYAVQQPEEIPSSVTTEDVARLRDVYRREFLTGVAPNLPDGSAPLGNWYELVGSAFNRTIYGLQMTSTTEQDEVLITALNDTPNLADYNGLFRNCADFARLIVDRFYPHAVRRNYVADLGVTSPKSVARGFSHYAAKHPECQFQAFRIPQLPGTLPRSHAPVTMMEGVSKEFGFPLLFVSPIATGFVVAAWLTQGRFSEPTQSPVLNLRHYLAPSEIGSANSSPAISPAASSQPGGPSVPAQVVPPLR